MSLEDVNAAIGALSESDLKVLGLVMCDQGQKILTEEGSATRAELWHSIGRTLLDRYDETQALFDRLAEVGKQVDDSVTPGDYTSEEP